MNFVRIFQAWCRRAVELVDRGELVMALTGDTAGVVPMEKTAGVAAAGKNRPLPLEC
jgi:hypothetical protein